MTDIIFLSFSILNSKEINVWSITEPFITEVTTAFYFKHKAEIRSVLVKSTERGIGGSVSDPGKNITDPDPT